MNIAASSDGVHRSPPPASRDGGPWIEAAIIIGFWIVMGLLANAQHALDPRFENPRGFRPGEFLHTQLDYLVWAALTPGIFWLARYFSPERRGAPAYLLLLIVTGVVVASAVDLFSHATWNALVPSGIRRPIAVTFVLNGFHFLAEFILYLVVLSAGFARDYFLRYQERQREAVELRAHAAELRTQAIELEAQLSEARLQALRMQINPHFLFNTLHTISTYLERDPRGVRRMIARLSDLLRYTLEMGSVKEVPLRQELAFIDDYLEIQSIRFEDALEIRRDIDDAVLDAMVPNLILQPLVENAIKHGASKRETGGRIELQARREGEWLHVSVRDNGPGLSSVPEGDGDAGVHAGIGLRNTRERLQSLYGGEQRLQLEPAAGGGLEARIVLPYHTGSDLYTTSVST